MLETLEGKISEPNSQQLLLRSDRKHPDWKHYKLAWFMYSPGQDGSTECDRNHPEHHRYPSAEHQRHPWSEMSAQRILKDSSQPGHSLFTLQKMQEYLLSYQQTTEQLPPSGCAGSSIHHQHFILYMCFFFSLKALKVIFGLKTQVTYFSPDNYYLIFIHFQDCNSLNISVFTRCYC